MGEMEMFTVLEVAEMLNLSERTIRRYISEGKLQSIKVLGNVRITKQELERVMKPVNK